MSRKVQINTSAVDYDYDYDDDDNNTKEAAADVDGDPFIGSKVRRKASMGRVFKGDYIDVRSKPYLIKILDKQGTYFIHFHPLFDI